ncbi:transglutaminase-like domain-containing protein [Agromyces lapidis]|uniref:Transglutaminase-like domain-containing protein n=1 Tax=Agromyces lapidis TaxID=279574 RepID=A0ABV5SPY4_9MICO|nr:transglutaminase-like domain-containing protein [Agromyces lapidis]
MTDSASTRLAHDFARHSPYSEPGSHRRLVAAVAPEPQAIHRAATATITHYRAGRAAPTAAQLADVDRRWISAILDAAAERAEGPLDAERADADRVGGCCRDHSLLAVSILREHGVPARTRLGFAAYFTPGFRHDHVVVEMHRDGRWVRFDPELGVDDGDDLEVHDLPGGEGSPFETAAEAWIAHREGRTGLADYGVAPGHPITGPWIVHGYVLGDLAHRMRSELLLWDGWGIMDAPRRPLTAAAIEIADRLAELTIAADSGDEAAEHSLAAIWRDDERARVGRTVTTASPTGRFGTTDLVSRETRWS